MHSVSLWNKKMHSVFLRNQNKLHLLLLWEKEDVFNIIKKKNAAFMASLKQNVVFNVIMK